MDVCISSTLLQYLAHHPTKDSDIGFTKERTNDVHIQNRMVYPLNNTIASQESHRKMFRGIFIKPPNISWQYSQLFGVSINPSLVISSPIASRNNRVACSTFLIYHMFPRFILQSMKQITHRIKNQNYDDILLICYLVCGCDCLIHGSSIDYLFNKQKLLLLI